MSEQILAQQSDQGKRLDIFLTEHFGDRTRSQIKKLVQQGDVTINGGAAKVHQFLRTGDVIKVHPSSAVEAAAPIEISAPAALAPDPTIIFENGNFLVLEKPAGLLVHATERGETNTLVHWLIAHYPAVVDVGEHVYRAGIIHRLDRDVSGIMVIAKNQPAFLSLKEQFRSRLVKKEYVALVYGHMLKQSGTIELPIGRNREGQFVAHPLKGLSMFHRHDRVAKTDFRVLEYVQDYTLLSVQIHTGRTHQIRAHLSAVGHPILGDQLYKPRKKHFNFLRQKIKVVDPGRIFLHSVTIGFNDQGGEWQEFHSPLPQVLTQFVHDKKQR